MPSYVVYLSFSANGESDPAYRHMLAVCKKAADTFTVSNGKNNSKNFQATCFQQDGTRHICLPLLVPVSQGQCRLKGFFGGYSNVKMTKKQAEAVGFPSCSLPPLPLELKFKGVCGDGEKSWTQCIALELSSESLKRIKSAVSGLTGLPTPSYSVDFDRKQLDSMHLSLYRKRGYGKGVKKGMKAVRDAAAGGDWGTVQVTEISIKLVGADYSDARILARATTSTSTSTSSLPSSFSPPWSCSTCTFLNKNIAAPVCAVCRSPRAQPGAASARGGIETKTMTGDAGAVPVAEAVPVAGSARPLEGIRVSTTDRRSSEHLAVADDGLVVPPRKKQKNL